MILLGRDQELTELDALVRQTRTGRSGALVVSGEAGVGKTALLDHTAQRATSHVQVRRMVASESEMELAYAGLQLLCGPMLDAAARLPAPQREALEIAFGLKVAAAPNPFLVSLAALGLLTEVAGDRGLLCIVDDAQWLDAASAQVLTFVARRLDAEGIAIVLAMRVVGAEFAGLPQLVVEGLGDEDARALLRRALPGATDPRVSDQLIAEARGNPLALQELPRALSPGDAASSALPLERRIERSLLAQLDPLPGPARLLLLLAAAEPTGDPALLWRASERLEIDAEHVDAVTDTGALVVGMRVGFRHPLVRSAVYRAASPNDRRRVHAALAEATPVETDPDRRAWHRASATLWPDEAVAADLERSAARARTRGGASAAAAFLDRAAELTPAPVDRAQRLIAAAEAKHEAGAPGVTLRLLDNARGQPLTALQEARITRLQTRAEYALKRERGAARRLLAAAQGLDGLDTALARDTYMEALAAAVYGGRLGDADEVAAVSRAILAATADDESERARDLLLRGQALLFVDGLQAALPTLRHALQAFSEQPPETFELHWMWFASRAAIDVWDSAALRALAERQVELARAAGILTVLPAALSLAMTVAVFDGRLDAAAAACDESDAVQSVTGHPFPQYGRFWLAAYHGRLEEMDRRAEQLRAFGRDRGEGFAISAANFGQALAYNGAGRYAEALDCARRELPYTHELAYAARAMLELVEAATRMGEQALAEEAFERLASITRVVGTNQALAITALAEAQVRADEALFTEAIERYERERVPMLTARGRLLHGELLRRRDRRIDAREPLRAAYEVFARCGYHGFAERAARELRATGETLRVRTPETRDELTPQEVNVARLAREGLTNRDIGARLYISARTAEYHLRKVFLKLGISSRTELEGALDAD